MACLLDRFEVAFTETDQPQIINPITLLFQTGYLTIDKIAIDELGELSYCLRVPNREVASALNIHFIGSYAELHSERTKRS